MDREQARDIVKGYLGDYLNSKGINTRKPFNCLNPEHPDRHPSMSYDSKRQRCKCFSCGASYDIFDLIGIDYGLTDDKDIFNKAYEMYGLTIDSPQQEQGKLAPAQKKEAQKAENFMDYYKTAQAARADRAAQDYLRSRGISEATAAKYWLGYDASYSTFDIDENGQNSFSTWRALIIPTGKSSYIARNIDTPKAPEKKNRYRKKGASLLFNSKALYAADKPVFIVEGELDALSIIEAGGQAVGLGSTSNYKQLLSLLEKQKAAQPLILALDADEEGRKTEEELAKELERLQASFYRYNLYGAAKDANEALLLDREGFIAEVRAAERAQEVELEAIAEAAREEYLKTSAAAHIQDFLQGITAGVNTPAISTGFFNLDSILDGGLYEGLYILGAISSLGKTTLALQLADNLAKAGQDVLIFSLEMARSELIAKSISRLTYLLADNKADAKTTRGITAGARYAGYSKTEKALINKAIGSYKEYAQHIFIHEGIGDIGVEKVKEVVQQHISITGSKPVVILDYIQILAPYDMRSTDKQNTDKAVLELKRLSRDCKVTVLGISSFNRDSYKAGGGINQGKVSMTDYKESGALEYSADVLMGLEFASAGTREYDERTEKKKDPRQIRLVVLKNRNGKAWESVDFKYYQMFNYFEEITGDFELVKEDIDIFKDLRVQKAK